MAMTNGNEEFRIWIRQFVLKVRDMRSLQKTYGKTTEKTAKKLISAVESDVDKEVKKLLNLI